MTFLPTVERGQGNGAVSVGKLQRLFPEPGESDVLTLDMLPMGATTKVLRSAYKLWFVPPNHAGSVAVYPVRHKRKQVRNPRSWQWREQCYRLADAAMTSRLTQPHKSAQKTEQHLSARCAAGHLAMLRRRRRSRHRGPFVIGRLSPGRHGADQRLSRQAVQ
jgi:hypothetical protein